MSDTAGPGIAAIAAILGTGQDSGAMALTAAAVAACEAETEEAAGTCRVAAVEAATSRSATLEAQAIPHDHPDEGAIGHMKKTTDTTTKSSTAKKATEAAGKSAGKTAANKTTETATKKTAAKRTSSKSSAAKKASTKSTSAKEPTTKSAAAKKTATKRTTAKKTTAKKSTTKETAAKKASTKKTAKEEAMPFADLPPVLIVAAEAAPLAKTGGLADVVGALPKYLARIGVDARIIMPFHRQIKDRYASEAEHLFEYYLEGAWEDSYVGIDKLELDGTTYYFVDSEYYFGDKIYSGDNFEGQQYAFFSEVVCDVIPNLGFDPGIIHCNDWHTALVPFKLKARYAKGPFDPPKTLLTIHNLAFQGTFGDDLQKIAIGPDEHDYAWDLGVWNMMKAGIDTADYVNTVSPTYAEEITTPEFGEGLQDDLRHLRDEGRLVGILNGIDTDAWDPETDPAIAADYSVGEIEVTIELEDSIKARKEAEEHPDEPHGPEERALIPGKVECKRELMQELGLDVDVEAPLVAMVGRLTPQKGIWLAAHVIGTLANEGVRFALLGSGDYDLEELLRHLEAEHRGRVCSYIGYDNDLSHRIYAASDFFLMPSAFEPCGISQMIAMRYGSLPIVHETGGLKDTVEPYNEFDHTGCGFSFSRFDGEDALAATRRAMSAYGDGAIMAQLIKNAMTRDFSFDRCARSYAELYRSMLR